jgi:hypothetical protein
MQFQIISQVSIVDKVEFTQLNKLESSIEKNIYKRKTAGK